MLNVIFDPISGTCVPDAMLLEYAEEVVSSYMHGGNNTITVGSSLIIDAIRVIFVRWRLSNNDVCFHYNNEKIFMKDSGKLSHYPEGFCDAQRKIIVELLKAEK